VLNFLVILPVERRGENPTLRICLNTSFTVKKHHTILEEENPLDALDFNLQEK